MLDNLKVVNQRLGTWSILDHYDLGSQWGKSLCNYSAFLSLLPLSHPLIIQLKQIPMYSYHHYWLYIHVRLQQEIEPATCALCWGFTRLTAHTSPLVNPKTHFYKLLINKALWLQNKQVASLINDFQTSINSLWIHKRSKNRFCVFIHLLHL